MDMSLSEKFAALSPETQKHLSFLGLFDTNVYTLTLPLFVGKRDEVQELYEDVMGSSLGISDWVALLDEAGSAGICRRIDEYVYEFSEDTSTFLRSQLQVLAGLDGFVILEREYVIFYATLCANTRTLLEQRTQNVIDRYNVEETNLLRALRLANESEYWEAVLEIARGIEIYYQKQGRFIEWVTLRDQIMEHLGRTAPSPSDESKGQLWIYMRFDEGAEAFNQAEPDKASHAYHTVLSYLRTLDDPNAQAQIAYVYSELGLTASLKRSYDEAEQWHLKALESYSKLGLNLREGEQYQHLGRAASHRKRIEDAERWYVKASKVFNSLGLLHEEVDVYHSLGRVFRNSQRLVEAQHWLHKALELLMSANQQYALIETFTQLGALHLDAGNPDQALYWCGSAFESAVSNNVTVSQQITSQLGEVMTRLGEEQFETAWRMSFKNTQPPIDDLRNLRQETKELRVIKTIRRIGKCNPEGSTCPTPLTPSSLSVVVETHSLKKENDTGIEIIPGKPIPLPGGVQRFGNILAHPDNHGVGMFHWIDLETIIVRGGAFNELVKSGQLTPGMDYAALVRALAQQGLETVDIKVETELVAR